MRSSLLWLRIRRARRRITELDPPAERIRCKDGGQHTTGWWRAGGMDPASGTLAPARVDGRGYGRGRQRRIGGGSGGYGRRRGSTTELAAARRGWPAVVAARQRLERLRRACRARRRHQDADDLLPRQEAMRRRTLGALEFRSRPDSRCFRCKITSSEHSSRPATCSSPLMRTQKQINSMLMVEEPGYHSQRGVHCASPW